MSFLTSHLAMMLACDLIMLYRAIRDEGIALPRRRPRLGVREATLYRTIRVLMQEGIQHPFAVQGVQPHFPPHLGWVVFQMQAPHISDLYQRLPHQSSVLMALHEFDYGDWSGAQLDVFPAVWGCVTIDICFYPIRADWYRRGYRHVALWRHMLSLPDRIRALDAEFCRSFPVPHTCCRA